MVNIIFVLFLEFFTPNIGKMSQIGGLLEMGGEPPPRLDCDGDGKARLVRG